MIRYIIKRAARAVGIIFSISLITFFILNVIPGDPVAAMLGEFADADKIAQVKAQMGLDTPLPVQYFNWLKDLLHGDMGTSYFQKKPVITLILQAFHYTVIMATAAYIVALIVGLTTGILAAVYHDRPLDRILMSLSALGISAPSFWVAIILQIYVGLRFDIFPVSGVKSPIGYVLPSAALHAGGDRSGFCQDCLRKGTVFLAHHPDPYFPECSGTDHHRDRYGYRRAPDRFHDHRERVQHSWNR